MDSATNTRQHDKNMAGKYPFNLSTRTVEMELWANLIQEACVRVGCSVAARHVRIRLQAFPCRRHGPKLVWISGQRNCASNRYLHLTDEQNLCSHFTELNRPLRGSNPGSTEALLRFLQVFSDEQRRSDRYQERAGPSVTIEGVLVTTTHSPGHIQSARKAVSRSQCLQKASEKNKTTKNFVRCVEIST